MNIESANKKREIISRSEEEDTSSQTLNLPETPKQNGMVKKLSQSVITKESLYLKPEGGHNQITQNGFAQEKADQASELNADNNVEHSDQVRSVASGFRGPFNLIDEMIRITLNLFAKIYPEFNEF